MATVGDDPGQRRPLRALRRPAGGHAAPGHGVEAANANLMGHVILSWDDEVTRRDTIVATLARGGFREVSSQV